MSTQPQVSIVEFSEIPDKVSLAREYAAVIQAARKLREIGVGRAIRIRLGNLDGQKAARKAHIPYRFSSLKVVTRLRDGHLYLWLKADASTDFEVCEKPRGA